MENADTQMADIPRRVSAFFLQSAPTKSESTQRDPLIARNNDRAGRW